MSRDKNEQTLNINFTLLVTVRLFGDFRCGLEGNVTMGYNMSSDKEFCGHFNSVPGSALI
jgi:hypothetical protein